MDVIISSTKFVGLCVLFLPALALIVSAVFAAMYLLAGLFEAASIKSILARLVVVAITSTSAIGVVALMMLLQN